MNKKLVWELICSSVSTQYMKSQLWQGGKRALLSDERSNQVVTFYFYVMEGLTETDDFENYENFGLINQYAESSYNLIGIFSKPCILE